MIFKKKLADILMVSFLVSMVIIISFFNLISEEQSSENLAGTVLFLLLFVSAEVISYILSKRAVGAFCFGYFSLVLLCFLYGISMELFDIGYNALAVFCAIVIAPFYGFIYVSEASFEYIAIASALILGAIGALICFFRKKERI